MAITISALFIFSMLTLMIPFFIWFYASLKKSRGQWTWRDGRMVKRTFFGCFLIAIILLVIGVVIIYV